MTDDPSVVSRPDLLVLGGNPGGCAAALTAARAGLSVLLLEPTATLGGHNANGVFAFDAGDPAVVGPVGVEFAALVAEHYAASTDPVRARREDPVWESQVAAASWARLCEAEPNLTVHLGAVPVDADREGRRVTEVRWEPATTPGGDPPAEPVEPPHRVRTTLIVDATYEADLLAWTGIAHRLGREARTRAEPHAGRILTNDLAGGPDGIPPQSVLPGSTGEADDAIMAFAARLHCRWYDGPAPAVAPGPDYDPARFRWTPHSIVDGVPVWFGGIALLVGERVVLNRIVDGNELSGAARDYVLAHPRERREHRDRIVRHALDFLHFVQTEGGCPQLGLADELFPDNSGVPYRVYVREGRRVVGLTTLTEADLSPYLSGDGVRPARRPDSVAVGDWPIESRACADVRTPPNPYPEGWFFDRFSRAPFQVPYACMVPPQVDNLLVCGGIGATHLAFGATRVESARINLGTAAGAAAALRPTAFGEVDVEALQERLIACGSACTFFADLAMDHPAFAAVQWSALRGWIPVDETWCFEPDRQVTWGELVDVLVTVLDVPRSVTGSHFTHVAPRHPRFLAFESLYDAGTRAGLDLFGHRALARERPVPDLLRHSSSGLPQHPDAVPGRLDSIALVTAVLGLCGDRAGPVPPGTAPLIRSDLALLLHTPRP
jgi:hypothetical protein